MNDKVAVVVAVIGTLTSAVTVIVTWMMNESIRSRTSQQGGQLAALQSEQRSSEERIKSSLLRSLAVNESALRVAGETELKLLAQASESIIQATALLAQSLGIAIRYSSAIETGRSVDDIPFDGVQQELLHTGVFLPPELDEPYSNAAHAVIEALGELIESQNAPRQERAKANEESEMKATRAVFQFRAAAASWKREAWNRVRAVGQTGLVESGHPNA